MKHLALLFLAALCLQTPHAQTLDGTVTDPAGTPVEGANISWKGTAVGISTNQKGQFLIEKTNSTDTLVVSFIGYKNDTIPIPQACTHIDILLDGDNSLDEIVITERRQGILKPRTSLLNEELITTAELSRAACCNLGESFTTNPSVDVSYSDAATGARQIKLLGLSGIYVQMLTENIPNYRGTAAPFALGYIPGPWMQSIQVSKGASSVKNGYESISGQINVEFKKPQDTESFSANIYANSLANIEANFDANTHLSQRLSTSLLTHYQTSLMSHDSNHDGFMDLPKVEQYNIQNRWTYLGDRYLFQSGIKMLMENRNSGQTHATETPRYRIGIHTERYEVFTKNAYIFNKEKNTNLALILSGSLHEQQAVYGHKFYSVNQWNGYASLLFETEFDKHNSLSAGLNLNHDNYIQQYQISDNGRTISGNETETVAGAYAQYTYNLQDKLTIMTGIRADLSNRYRLLFTPRLHIKYTPNDIIHLRASVGKGFRSVHVLAENNYLLASSRKILIDSDLKIEEAWNSGISAALYIPLFNKTLNINLEYYYTDFLQQTVIDLDSDPHAVHFTNLQGKSYSHTFQAEISYPVFKRFLFSAAYRLTDAKTTYNQTLKERPFTGKYKGLITASYQTAMAIWQFDATLQINGGGRLPTPYLTDENTLSWDYRYKTYEQLNIQITKNFRHFALYIGGENLTGFRQPNPIIDASNPWGDKFDSSITWGPMHGAVFYIGFKYNWEKL